MVFLQENILQAVTGTTDFHSSPDLVLTEDFTGVNAGAISYLSFHTKWLRALIQCGHVDRVVIISIGWLRLQASADSRSHLLNDPNDSINSSFGPLL